MATMKWSAQYDVVLGSGSHLTGDKIALPPSALESLLASAPTVSSSQRSSIRNHASSFDPYNPYTYAAERQARAQDEYLHQQLPHPLIFRLINPSNGRIVYAGIREFSAAEGEAVLSRFLEQALGFGSTNDTPLQSHTIQDTTNRVTVHVAEIPKGTFVKLRPLEAGYDPEDWKSLLEEQLRKNFTTLTRGELLNVPSGRRTGSADETFNFLIDQFAPEGDGICVVDTDLEVDIEPLNEEQARETVKKIAARVRDGSNGIAGSTAGGQLSLFRPVNGQVASGQYIDYELPSWDRSQGLEIELSSESREDCLELYASPFGPRQRVKPRDNEHVFSELDCRPIKRLRISPTNVELENAESLYISIYTPNLSQPDDVSEPASFTLRAFPFDPEKKATPLDIDATPSETADTVRCKNCQQLVAKQSLVLHENFCFRNNILCPKGCGQVFLKNSPAWQENHWHCEHDTHFGFSNASRQRHNEIFHKEHSCPNCSFNGRSLLDLAQHLTSVCPGKLILCRFCHLVVPQEGDPDGAPNPEALLSDLTPHELADGGRTTDCHLCQRIVRLRDMETHMKNHEFERLSRSVPRVCRNVNCGRTLDGVSKSGDTRAGSRIGQGAGNEVGLCSICFGPLYVSMHDPEGKALKRRVERRYLSQVVTGCGKNYCRNPVCKTGVQNMGAGGEMPSTTKDALPMIKPYVDGLMQGSTPLHFCVDEASQGRRNLAEMLAAEERLPGQQQYGFEWCLAALEAESGKLDAAREWLRNFAPAKDEER